MRQTYYQEYIQAKERGDRSLAADKLRWFIDSFECDSDKILWVRQFLESGEYGHKIHHALYQEVIFPVLLSGYTAQDPWSVYFLAKTVQNLHEDRELHEKVGWHTERSLLKLCFELEPDFRDVREYLLRAVVGTLEFYIHEWPSGLCGEITDVEEYLALGRRLDSSNNYTNFFDEVSGILEEAKLRHGHLPVALQMDEEILATKSAGDERTAIQA